MSESINKTKLNKDKTTKLIYKFSLCSIRKHSRERRIKYRIRITISGKPKIAVREAFPAFDAMEDKSVKRNENAIAPNNITTKNNGKFLIGVPSTIAKSKTLNKVITSIKITL